MKISDMHQKLLDHYARAHTLKTKRSIQIQSKVGQAYKKKAIQIDDMSPLEDFLRNQNHVGVEAEPLYFRQLPRKLKVYFPGPPIPPPKLQQIPYTYQIVPKVPFKLPKQKPGFIGDWILQDSKFIKPQFLLRKKRGHKSMIEGYKSETNDKKKNLRVQAYDRRQRFRSEVKKLAKNMKEKNLSFKQIIKNKGLIKKSCNFYNSIDFFLMARAGDKQIENLLEKNPELAFDIDEQQMTGLHWAARQGHVYICRILIQRYRANTLSKDCYGRTPLHLAVENKHVECIIRIFIEGGQMNSLNNKKQTVRMVAPDSYIKYLLEKLQEIRFVIKSKKLTDKQNQRQQLQTSIRNTLDQSSLYF